MGLADYIGKYWTGAEVMYGIIITMTFTSMLRGYPGIFSAVIGRVILAALLCCVAWGIADGFFYLWERNYIVTRENRIIASSRSASGRETARALIKEELEDTILRTVPDQNKPQLADRLIGYLAAVDLHEAISLREAATIVGGTFLLSAGAGFVVVLPFFIIPDAGSALIVSNIIGILLLFAVGWMRAMDRSFALRLRYGCGAACVGIIIAGITVVMGG